MSDDNRSLLEKDNWLERNIVFMISDITEYDMRRAGLSISKEDKLLPEDVIKQLESMPKKEADIAIGKRQLKDAKFKASLMEGFRKYRLKFGEMNEISNDDIVSVKKDAIFTKKYCEITVLGENIEFREKNSYQARLYLNDLEFYWKHTGELDVKGIRDEKIQLHQDFLIHTIWKVMEFLGSYDYDNGLKYLVKFMNDYKFKRLPIEYYRELNQSSEYTYVIHEQPETSSYLDEVYKPFVMGHYNYRNILVPLMNLFTK